MFCVTFFSPVFGSGGYFTSPAHDYAIFVYIFQMMLCVQEGFDDSFKYIVFMITGPDYVPDQPDFVVVIVSPQIRLI